MVTGVKRRNYHVKWWLAAALIAAAIHWGPKLFSEASAPQNGPQGGPPVSVAQVVMKPVRQWSEFSGVLEAVDSVELRPRVGGQIMAVHFRDGEQVKKGQPLFTIDPRPYEAALISAKGVLADATSSLARAGKLLKTKAISRAEFDQRQSAYDQALGNFKAAGVNLDYTRITAPINGKIGRAEITAGNVVEAGQNAPVLATIVTLDPLYVAFDLDEKTFLTTIRGVPQSKLAGVPVEIGLANEEGTPITAAIYSFDNRLSLSSGTIRVRARVENKDGALIPGLFAKVRIGSAETTPQLLINPTAVGTDQSKKFVLVAGEGDKAEYREVELDGMVDGLEVVKSGLKEGERIVVNGLQRLRPGAPFLPQTVDMLTLKAEDAGIEGKAGGDATAAEAQ